MKAHRALALMIVLMSAKNYADTQVAQLRLTLESHAILNFSNDGGAGRVIFQDVPSRVELVLTVAAMPSPAKRELPGLFVGEQWPNRVQWTILTDHGNAITGRDPMFERETEVPHERGRVGVGEKIAAAFRLPPLALGTYRLTARVGTLQSNVARFVVSDGTESIPLRTTYAWVQARRERSPVLRDKWLRQLGELDPAMPAPWIDLGDEALDRGDLTDAQQYFERAIESYAARHAKFEGAGAPELIRAIDEDNARYGKVVAEVRSALSSGGQLVVQVRRDRGKQYVLSDRRSGKVVQTIEVPNAITHID